MRSGLGMGYGVVFLDRVRDKASVRARVLCIIYYCRNVLELKLPPSGIFGEKNQKASDLYRKFPRIVADQRTDRGTDR